MQIRGLTYVSELTDALAPEDRDRILRIGFHPATVDPLTVVELVRQAALATCTP